MNEIFLPTFEKYFIKMLFERSEKSLINFWRSQKFHEGEAFISSAGSGFHPKHSFGFHCKRETFACPLCRCAIAKTKGEKNGKHSKRRP